MDETKSSIDLTEHFRRWLVKVDMIFHIIAALLLLGACSFIMYFAALNIISPSRNAIIHLVNDVLLALIILELLWTVIRFLKKQKFVLGPFLAIGIIAAVRRILLIEAQTSFMEHVPVEKLYELGLSAAIIITLMIAYYLSIKAQKLEQ
ncbi:MAG: phosphate-starvation-inducible PsiE family protein [Nitrospirota bacterium]